MFAVRFLCLLLASVWLSLFLTLAEAAPRPQEQLEPAASDLQAGVEAEEKDLEGAASLGYGYYSSPYYGSYYGGGYWPHYSGSYYGLGEFGYPHYGGYYGNLHHHHHGHYGHFY